MRFHSRVVGIEIEAEQIMFENDQTKLKSSVNSLQAVIAERVA